MFRKAVAHLLLVALSEARLTALHAQHQHEQELEGERGSHRELTRDEKYCDEPVAKGKVTFPESLAGRTTQNFNMFSGYVNVTQQDWLFYWFFEADSTTTDGGDDVPLILWTNGGPGCSAMEGATTENGPLVLYRIKESYELATGQLSNNPYAWNKQGHVLYVDQPKYVGNSFGYGDACHSSEEAGQDIVTFLQGWYDLFPEHAGRKLVISGESYGGHYVPAWAGAILDHNEQVAKKQNGVKKTEQEQGRGLLGQAGEGKRGESASSSSAPPSSSSGTPIPLAGIIIGNGCVNDTLQQDAGRYVEFLNLNGLLPEDPPKEPTTMAFADVLMAKHIGYAPNYYDFRVQNVQCDACYAYNYTEWSYWFLKSEVKEALHICGDAGMDAFAGNAGGCISMPGFDTGDTFDYSGTLGRALDSGVDLLLLYGKNDLACNYYGAHAMASAIPWSGQAGFNAASIVEGAPCAGCQMQTFQPEGGSSTPGTLLWVQVDAAGHMVPLDEPAAAAAAVQLLLAGM